MRQAGRLHFFDCVGIELEYMLVSGPGLDVFPAADRLIHAACGEYTEEIERGPVAWSNELVLHVIEFKTNGPACGLDGLPDVFSTAVRDANSMLAPMNARLMPTGMHPWMDPLSDTKLWPHEYSKIYETYNRIFDCSGHGWSNLQSMHINLPFAGDAEFARLHAAVRLLLPVMPALAASSPIADGQRKDFLDYRLEVYRHNSDRVPSVAGHIIPEPLFSIGDYNEKLLGRMYRDIAPLDPEGIIRHEWLNSRGAIARFERNTIEIRVIDMQECPAADISVAAAIIETLKSLTRERWCSLEDQKDWEIEPLEQIFLAAVADADGAVIDNRRYLEAFGLRGIDKCEARDLWRHLIACAADSMPAESARLLEPAKFIVENGTLARRIINSLGAAPSWADIHRVYNELCACLAENRMFEQPES